MKRKHVGYIVFGVPYLVALSGIRFTDQFPVPHGIYGLWFALGILASFILVLVLAVNAMFLIEELVDWIEAAPDDKVSISVLPKLPECLNVHDDKVGALSNISKNKESI